MGLSAVAGVAAGPGDDALVRAVQLDPARFVDIYERYRSPVYRYLRAWGSDDDLARELTAVTFERAIAGIGGYQQGRSTLGAWLLRIARNARIDEQRRRGRLTDLGPAARLADDAHDMAADVELRLLLSQLSSDTREAITLRYANGLTSHEIGLVIGKRAAAVQKLIERGLRTLREAIDDQA